MLSSFMITLAGDSQAAAARSNTYARKKKTKESERATPAPPRDDPARTTSKDCDTADASADNRECSESPLFESANDEHVQSPTSEPAEDTSTIAMDTILNSIEVLPPTTEDEVDLLDPSDSPRHYWRDPLIGIKREVWRPGDGDGDKGADYYERPGQRPPLEQRWRFYQLPSGRKPFSRTNMPPKYVMLDDRAAYEVLFSDIPRAILPKHWSHDFGGSGRIRSRRPHTGRGAISNALASGDDKYHFSNIGLKNEKYYFSGEHNYTPILYRRLPTPTPPAKQPQPPPKKRKASSPPAGQPKDPRKHGHNQYTPKDQLVRLGAPSAAKGRQRYRARINTFLRRSASPSWAKDRAKLYGGIGEQAKAYMASREAGKGGASDAEVGGPAPAVLAEEQPEEESLWVQEDEESDVGEYEEGYGDGVGDQDVDVFGEAEASRRRSAQLFDRELRHSSRSLSAPASAFQEEKHQEEEHQEEEHQGEEHPDEGEETEQFQTRDGKSTPTHNLPSTSHTSMQQRIASSPFQEEASADFQAEEHAVDAEGNHGAYVLRLEAELEEAREKIWGLEARVREVEGRLREVLRGRRGW